MDNKSNKIINEVKKMVKGKDDVIKKVLAAILANGHILLEDIPGVGKTTLALAFSEILNLEYKRVQFTPDVMPSDITGFTMYNAQTKDFEYKAGAIMCNLFLADEINRTSPKTQSSLLEVMEEGKVTVEGVSRKVPAPFTVIATQNPVGSAGTQKLPESQLDRFLVRLSMGYPDHSNAINILKGYGCENMEELHACMTPLEVSEMQECVKKLFVHEEINEYIVNLTEATRKEDFFLLGVSPRGSIALLKMAKSIAYLNQRDYVIPEDIHEIYYDVFCHRVILSSKARAKGLSEKDALQMVLRSVSVPKL